MEAYKEKLKISQMITAIATLLLVGFSILFLCAEGGLVTIAPAAGDSRWQSMWRGFVCGAAWGIAAMMIISLIRTAKALHSEEALKKLYIKEHDERTIQIWTAARAAATQTALLVGLVAGVIAGYFSMTVGITIIACVLAQSLMGMGFKIYYSRKF